MAKSDQRPVGPRFRVDTKLFQELGELLVGRESTALAELIKNAYDADARRVVVHGHDVTSENGFIVVTDDGNGMDGVAFSSGFLTIASRTKIKGDRSSPRFRRRYTGEKGVGRLAAHKLATRMVVSSDSGPLADSSKPQFAKRSIKGTIDWQAIDEVETLDDVPPSAVTLEEVPARKATPTGTRIKLSPLRRKWTTGMIRSFVSEAMALRPEPSLERAPPPDHFSGVSIIKQIKRNTHAADPGCEIELQGAFQEHEELVRADPTKAMLCIEIRCDASKNEVEISILPSKDAEAEGLEPFRRTLPMKELLKKVEEQYGVYPRVSFKARIYERFRAVGGWPSHAAGVRIFMEGFRVLPYAEGTDDWLSLKADVIKRSWADYKVLDEILGPDSSAKGSRQSSPGHVLHGDHMFMGAVFLTHEGAPDLKMLVNREGFLPGAGIEGLRTIVRSAIQIATRARAAMTKEIPSPRRANAKAQQKATKTAESDSTPTAYYLLNRAEAMRGALERAVNASTPEESTAAIAQAQKELAVVSEVADELFLDQSMIRVLASLGTQLSVFSHEVGHLLPAASGLVDGLGSASKILREAEVPAKVLRQAALAPLKTQADVLLRSLERQAVYLTDVSATAARRRRGRHFMAERFESAKRLFVGEIERLEIEIVGSIDGAWKSPLMFASELTMIFANVLSNAIKAAGQVGRIKVTDRKASKEHVFRIENTGVAIDLAEADKWFKPFRSSAATADPVLGQGMGLGLTITRSMLDEYGAGIAFVKPSARFSTALEISFPAD